MADVESQSCVQKKSPKYEESMDEEDEEEELFEVEEIIGKSKTKGIVSYKVRWKGFGSEEDTWEPEDNLGSCQELIDEFNKKRDENLRQKAEERKLRQQMMEGRISSSESSEENFNSPYPPNFKNSFWKDLEAGRIDVFDSNIYSKVKERRVKIQSLKEFKESRKRHAEQDSSQEENIKSSKPKVKTLSQESATDTDEKKRQKHKKHLSHEDNKRKENVENIHKSKKIRNSDYKKAQNTEYQKKRPISEAMVVDTDSSVKMDSKKINVKLKNVSGKWTSEFVSAKKCCGTSSKDRNKNVVKKKKLEVKIESCDSDSSEATEPNMIDNSESENGNKDKTDLQDCELNSNIAVKLESENEFKVKTYSMDCDLNSIIQNIESENIEQKSVKVEPVISAIKTELFEDFIVKDRSHSSHESLVVSSHNSSSLSHDISLNSSVFSTENISPISHNSSHPKTSSSSVVNKSEEKHPQSLLSCNTNIKGKQRLDSETVDSGIASPASEKSLGLSRCESNNPLDDVLDRSLLPFLPDTDKIPVRETDHDFEINLDDLDWDMFDREVKLEPITLSNDEFVKAVMTGDYERVKQALMGEGKYDLEYADLTGKTLLMHAAQHAYDDIADLLIEHGANINAQMNNGFTPLMTACQFAELCTVNLLIELGAKVNLQTYNGESALMIAVRRGHRHITWLLLECGANFSLKSQAGYTALNYAQAFHHIETESVITTHIKRVMTEFENQISVTLNNLANIREMIFPPQVFNISEEEMFQVNFNHMLQLPPIHGLGYILFLGHAVFTSEDVKCRFYGPCAVKSACLNGNNLTPLTQAGNFVLSFNPVTQGNNILTINTVKETNMKGKLIVCAYKAQLV